MNSPTRTALLADTLTVLRPDPAETDVLRLALGIGDVAAAKQFGSLAGEGGIFAKKPMLRRLYPMLGHSLGGEVEAFDRRLAAMLRAGTLWEEQRTARLHEILAIVLSTLRSASVSPILLKGVALAETAYPRPSLRHCHDIDLLIDPRDLEAATAALTGSEFQLAERQPPARAGSVYLVHRDGLPIQFHTRLLPAPQWTLPTAAMVARAEVIDIAGQSVRIFRPADMLLHVCALAGQGAAISPGWVVDAALIQRTRPLTAEDWEALTNTAADSGLALPILVMLACLADAFAVPVPNGPLERLAGRVRHLSRAEKDAILAATRRAPGVRLTHMIDASGWRSRLEILRWLVAPSPPHLKAWCAERNLPWSPVWYVARPFRRIGVLVATRATFRSAAI